jgi:hypothetical protein
MNGSRKWRLGLLLGGLALIISAFGAPQILGGGATIRLESGGLGPGESTTLTLEGLGFSEPGLGAITVDVGYDPRAVAATECEADPAGIFQLALCNAEFASGTVRITAVDPGGESGDFSLAQITFAAAGGSGSQTLDVTIVTLADAAGVELDALSEGGTLFIDGDADSDDAEDEPDNADSEPTDAEDEPPDAEDEPDGAVGEPTDARDELPDADGESDDLPTPAGEEAADTGDDSLLQPDSVWLYVAVAILAVGLAAGGFIFMRKRRKD